MRACPRFSFCVITAGLAVACGDGGAPGAASTGGGGVLGSGGAPGGTGGVGAGETGGVGAGETGGVGAGGTGGVGAAETGGTSGVGGAAPPASPYIVVDQFGYLPGDEKIAVIRDPQTGFDAAESFSPGATYALVNIATGATVYSAAPAAWNGGATDSSSGDRAHWFEFTSVTAPGDYYVMDVERNVRSHPFAISDGVYRDVLRQAVRMLYYQRAGAEKDAAHAGVGWADGASFVGPLQDHQCRLFSDPNNAATERDVWGGWYDAGDPNKYTSWTAGYVQGLLRAYAESPAAFTDDYGIPESGNGVPDVLDEARWGLDYLARLQDDDGSVLSIVGEPSASPPSTATGQCLYGPASTSATLATAAAFATAARVLLLPGIAALDAAAGDLRGRAERAWDWAEAHPAVVFRNNDSASGSSGLGAGQQETDDYGRLIYKLDAAGQLFAVTGDAQYRTFFDANYAELHLIAWSGYVAPWDIYAQDAALDYAAAPGATAATVSAIRSAYLSGVRSSGNLGAYTSHQDPYRAHLENYVWGSSAIKAHMGNIFANVVAYGLDPASNAQMTRAAAGYIHYLHGVNPLSMVYLTNMNDHGAESSIAELFHFWFADGSARWDRVGVSTYGPPPGFLTGGPNPSYDWDGCCPSSCGSDSNNALCTSEPISPPKGQPAQKSYKDFNTGWPLNTWSISEPSDGYQVTYIRLLSKFVR